MMRMLPLPYPLTPSVPRSLFPVFHSPPLTNRAHHSGHIEPLWHAWISYTVDTPPNQDPLRTSAERPWAPRTHVPNLTFSRGAYKTYSTCVETAPCSMARESFVNILTVSTGRSPRSGRGSRSLLRGKMEELEQPGGWVWTCTYVAVVVNKLPFNVIVITALRLVLFQLLPCFMGA